HSHGAWTVGRVVELDGFRNVLLADRTAVYRNRWRFDRHTGLIQLRPAAWPEPFCQFHGGNHFMRLFCDRDPVPHQRSGFLAGRGWHRQLREPAQESDLWSELLQHRPDSDEELPHSALGRRKTGDWRAGVQYPESPEFRSASARHRGTVRLYH